MSIWMPQMFSCRATLYRTDQDKQYETGGSDADSTPFATHVPCSIQEITPAMLPKIEAMGIQAKCTVYFDHDPGLAEQDRIEDEEDGTTYAVMRVINENRLGLLWAVYCDTTV